MEFDHTEVRDVLSSVLDEMLERKLAAILPSILDVKLDPITNSLDFLDIISKGFDETEDFATGEDEQSLF